MRILMVDDHTLFRQALLPLLDELFPGARLFEASSAEEALAAARNYPDISLILLDLSLPGKSGLDILPSLQSIQPDTPIVILSGERAPQTIRKAMTAGARGFIPKSANIQEMKQALQLIRQGEIYLPLSLITAVNTDSLEQQANTAPAKLTQRQQQILRMLSQGQPNKSIASELGVSVGTVKLHVSALMQALGARNRTEAAHMGVRIGLVDSD